MAQTERIVVDPKVLTGKPVVRGTRISVELLAAGWSHTQILTSHPHLTGEDIRPASPTQANFSAKRGSIRARRHDIPG
jgi:uncharacterized protein (DUF433 family)